jgi:hypothetical protein
MRTIRRIISSALSLILLLYVPGVLGGYREGVAEYEIRQLPKFCWAQMEVPGAVGPQYSPQNCGPGTNHYCPGLVSLLRAKSPLIKSTSDRAKLLRAVEKDIIYTEGWIKSYPNCSIKPHVLATKAEVGRLLAAHGGSLPSTK